MSSSHFQFALCLAFVVQDINRQLPAPANSCHASSPLWALSPRNCKTKYIHSSISHFLSRCFITAAKSNSCGCLSPDSQTWLLKLYGSWTHLPIFVLLLYSLTSRSCISYFCASTIFLLVFSLLEIPLEFHPFLSSYDSSFQTHPLILGSLLIAYFPLQKGISHIALFITLLYLYG